MISMAYDNDGPIQHTVINKNTFFNPLFKSTSLPFLRNARNFKFG